MFCRFGRLLLRQAVGQSGFKLLLACVAEAQLGLVEGLQLLTVLAMFGLPWRRFMKFGSESAPSKHLNMCATMARFRGVLSFGDTHLVDGFILEQV